MVKQANYAVSDKKPEAMKSSVTEEMIADYKKEVMKPVEIGGKYHLYRPVEIPPPLVKPPPKPYDHGGAYITEAEAQREAGIILNDINKFETELDRLNDLKKRLEDRFTLSSSAFDEALVRDTLDELFNPALEQIIKDKGLPMPKPKTKANLINAIIDAEKGVIENVKTDLGKVEADIIQIIGEIKGAKTAFEAELAKFNRQADVDEENRLKEIEFQNKKRQIAQEALGDFNRLNQGKIQVARQSNETDDEFLTRLQQMGNIFIDPADMEKQIITEILLKAKTHIRTYK